MAGHREKAKAKPVAKEVVPVVAKPKPKVKKGFFKKKKSE